jgi:large subunit ribosomal protein L5
MKNTLEKIVINTSFGKLATSAPEFEAKLLPEIKESLAAIVGQAPQERTARISISGFKIREGMIIGLKATLRGKKMRQFIERTIAIVMPRIRDFHGIPTKSVDGQGNLTFGIREHIVFPEIVLEKVRANFGIEVTLVPRTRMSKEEALEFYRGLGIPFEKEAAKKKIK